MFVNCSLRLLLALLASGLVFALLPGIDLAFAGLFYNESFFVGRSGAAPVVRQLLLYLPFGVIGLWLACAAFAPGRRLVCFPSLDRRNVIFVAMAILTIPGLVVNFGLKDNWGRPRPVHVEQFGGQQEFRSWWQAGGACMRNCSFVSGEVAMMATLAAPALIASPGARAAALAAVALLTIVSAVLRVAAGGHFLSDVVMAALLSWILVLQLYGAFYSPHFAFWAVRQALLLQGALRSVRAQLVRLQVL